MPSAAQKRAKEFFLQACETGEGPYAGLSLDEILDIEKQRKPVPNRATARRYGIRSGYTRRLGQRLALAAEIRRVDRAEETAAMQAARKARAAEAAAA